MAKKYSERDLVEQLREVADTVGGTPTTGEIREHSPVSLRTFSQRFGSIPKAREAAGVGGKSGSELRDEFTQIKSEELLEDLQRLTKKLGRPPSGTEIDEYGDFCPDTYTDRFGSVPDAREEAGLERAPNYRAEKLGAERIESECQHCGECMRLLPSRADQRFCSVDCMGQAARQYSSEEILSALQELGEDLGRAPSAREFDEKTDYWHGVFESRDDLESFSTEVERAGFDPRNRCDLSDDEILADLRSVAETVGRPPRLADICEHGKLNSYRPFQERWGTFTEALKTAGLSPDSIQLSHVSGEELLAEFRRVADEIGNPPSYTDIQQFAEYSGVSYERQFGSFLDAKQAAGFDKKPSQHNQPRGEDHYQWKGGSDPEYGSNWREQREKALERDSGVCQRCGISSQAHIDRYGTHPHVHHITPWDEFDSAAERNRLDNLVTLCASCHKRIEELPVTPQFNV